MVRQLFTYIFILTVASLSAQGYSVKILENNLEADLFSPAYYRDLLVISSNAKLQVGKTIIDESGKELTNLYVLNPKNPEKIEVFDRKFHSVFHDGPAAFNKNADLCVLSRNMNHTKGNKSWSKKDNYMGLFISVLQNNEWSEPVAFPYNLSEYSSSHPALNDKGDWLVFTSNRPGGKGGFDLWASHYTNGRWTEPVNLDFINTEFNEVFPGINGSYLTFSSDRGDGFGGLDIYVSDYNSRDAGVLMDAPINSDADDFGVISRDELNSGYFTSNRNKHDRIFSFTFENPVFGNCELSEIDDYCYDLYEENASKVLQHELVYRWKINDEMRYGYQINYCFPGPGDYQIDLDIIDTVLNETYANQASYSFVLDNKEQVAIVFPDTVGINQKNFIGPFSTFNNIRITGYYWQIDEENIRGKTDTVSFDKPGEHEIKLLITGVREEEKISQCVYKKVYVVNEDNYLVRDRIKINPDSYISNSRRNDYEYYGIDLFPNDSSPNLNGRQDLLKGYELRMEYDEKSGKMSYLVGKWEDVNDAYPTWKKLKQSGFDKAKVRLFVKADSTTVPIDDVFSFDSLQFNKAEWKILPAAQEELKILVRLLQEHPELIVNIAAYTDSEGPDDYNLNLSENRARSVKDYLISHGVDNSRIRAKGFGEAHPIGNNKTPEGKKLNRRVEFKLTIKEN